jgi:hypothetical protein
VDGSPVARRQAALDAFFPLLTDPESTVRAAAANAIGRLGKDSRSAARLDAARNDPDRSVRIALARALLEVNGTDDHRAADMLLGLLADPEPYADRRDVLQGLLSASAEDADRAVETLGRLLDSDEPMTVADALDALPVVGPRGRPLLKKLERMITSGDPTNFGAALAAFIAIDGPNNPRVRAVRLAIIRDPTQPYDQRLMAMEAIYHSDPAALTSAGAELVRQLNSPDPNVRGTAHTLLGFVMQVGRVELPENPPPAAKPNPKVERMP